MCILCEYEEKGIEIPGTVNLVIAGCPRIRKIPNIPRLQQLICIRCDNLKKIYPIQTLESLTCSNNTRLKKLPVFPNLRDLDCSKCPIRTIPILEKLEMLTCNECPRLVEIPEIDTLVYVHCVKSILLERILSWRALQNLACWDCRSLEAIPNASLVKLYCQNCPLITVIPDNPHFVEISCAWCVRLTAICPSLSRLRFLRRLEALYCTALIYIPLVPENCRLNLYGSPNILQGRISGIDEVMNTLFLEENVSAFHPDLRGIIHGYAGDDFRFEEEDKKEEMRMGKSKKKSSKSPKNHKNFSHKSR